MSRTLFLSAGLLFGVFLGALCPTQATAADLTQAQEKLVDQSFEARRAGNNDLAFSKLKEAIAQGDHPTLHLYLAEIEIKRGHCTEAHNHLAKAEDNGRLVWPTKDPYGDRIRSARYKLHRGCTATVVLTCDEGVSPSLEGHPVRCGDVLKMKPGTYVITATTQDGQRTMPRRIIALGAEKTTLRLDPPDNDHPMARWVPTSPQRIPEQDPVRDGQRHFRNIAIIGTATSALITGLSISLLVLAYSGGDPADDPDPALSEEEQIDAELLYDRRVAFGWTFSVIGTLMTSAGIIALVYAIAEDEPNDTPGFSIGPDMHLVPLTGEVWGGALTVEF